MDLLPLIFAIIIPLGWAVIFYPFMRRAKKRWDILILIATLLSFSTLILKEIIHKVDSPLYDTFIYGLGIIFGVLVLYSFFRLKSNWLEGLPKDDMFFRDHRIEEKIPMRHLFQIAIRLEEEGKDFYTILAEKASDEKARKMWQKLANDETDHKRLFEKTLSQWLPRPADKESLNSLINELRDRGLFSNPLLPDATEEEAVKYAIHNEEMTADFYLSFEKTFPDAWRKMHIQELVTMERQHAENLRDFLATFSVPPSAKVT
jgi:rubrerythrin